LVWGEENVDFLRKRYEAMQECHLFSRMTYSEDYEQLKQWMPLIMEDREPGQQPMAATRIDIGTDVNFGELTRGLFQHLKGGHDVEVLLSHEVRKLKKEEDGLWRIVAHDRESGNKKKVRAKFVFIGAGGGSLLLLEKSDIEEGKGFGGFPVSGQWLICKNEELIDKHHAKVYGKASVGAPPMSVPHLDTRIIDGKKALLFGPYAGFTTKFLKEGSFLDLPSSIELSNIGAMLGAFIHNLPLTRYLIEQVTQSDDHRFDALREFIPNANPDDWELANAGQRVQVIKKDEEEGGVLEFGTEIVTAADGSIAALLGASPGASTSVSIMLDLMEHCFSEKMKSPEWKAKLKEMVPTYGEHLLDQPELTAKTREWSHQMLDLVI
jgi:malate dehydrogenase (quinone)